MWDGERTMVESNNTSVYSQSLNPSIRFDFDNADFNIQTIVILRLNGAMCFFFLSTQGSFE